MPNRVPRPPIQSVLHVAKMTGVAGMENHLLTLLPGLKVRGLDVRLLILSESDHPMGGYAARLEAAGVPTLSVPIHRDLDLGLLRRLTRLFRDMRPDAVHTHLIHADWHGIVAAWQADIKSIFTTGHNDDPFRRRLVIRLAQRWLWQHVTKGIAISEAVRRFQISVEGAPLQRLVTIPYGLAITSDPPGEGKRAMVRHELGIEPQSPVFGSVCRLVEQKGIDDALRAFWQISRRLADAHYAVIGDGPLRPALEAQAAGYQLAHRIHFVGWRDDATTLMTALDALVVPSRWEGFGLAVLEAMAARVPVIAASVGALPEIVLDGQTGYLTKPGDIEGLAQAMLDICEYPAQAHDMGEAAHRRVETEFSAERMIDRTAQVYNKPDPA